LSDRGALITVGGIDGAHDKGPVAIRYGAEVDAIGSAVSDGGHVMKVIGCPKGALAGYSGTFVGTIMDLLGAKDSRLTSLFEGYVPATDGQLLLGKLG
jgi:hypothetical protein